MLDDMRAAWKHLPAQQRRWLTVAARIAILIVIYTLRGVHISALLLSWGLALFLFAPAVMGFVANQSWSVPTRRAALGALTAGFVAVLIWLFFVPSDDGTPWDLVWKAGVFAYLILGLYIAERQWRSRLIEPAQLRAIIESAVARVEALLHLERLQYEEGPATDIGLPVHVYVRYDNGNWIEWYHPVRRQSWPTNNAYDIVQSNGRLAKRALRKSLGGYCEVRAKRQPKWHDVMDNQGG